MSDDEKGLKVLRMDDAIAVQRRFQRMLQQSGDKVFTLSMRLDNWCVVHSLVSLGSDNPGVQDLICNGADDVAQLFRDAHKEMLKVAGMSEADAEAIIKMREDQE